MMQFYDDKNISRARKISYLALFTALALVIWMVEEFFPKPVPWLKPGFSYIVIIAAMEVLGLFDAFVVAIVRVIIGSLLFGRLFSPSFLLSISGTVSALVVMSLLFPLRKKYLSLAGISIAGAFAHISAQIFVAGALFYRPDAVLWLLPPMTIWTIFAGAIVGIITIIILEKFKAVKKVSDVNRV
ncbi:hypothetical protein DRQ26_02870 [bacterium]|nr:MAG: hypothetical protein DRQ26_02870 [bacterium]